MNMFAILSTNNNAALFKTQSMNKCVTLLMNKSATQFKIPSLNQFATLLRTVPGKPGIYFTFSIPFR